MSDVDLTVQYMTIDGLEVAYTGSLSADNTYKIRNDGQTFLHMKNGATDAVATVETPVTVNGLAVENPTVTCTANEERMIGPFPPSIYNDADGDVNITFDDVSNLTIAAIRLGSA